MTADCPEIPVVAGPWKLIAPKPDLSSLGLEPAPGDRTNEPNDHTFFRDAQGRWHLWACVRNTAVGRILYHWRSDKLTDSPWEPTGQVIRADKAAGESRIEYRGQEFIQSPFVVVHQGLWYMFYGGYATGQDPQGQPTEDYGRMENQISLMTSPDGIHWQRRLDDRGRSRVFAGGGAARDPFIGYFQGRWHAYYAGHHDCRREQAAIYHRVSDDLVNWSEWDITHDAQAGGPYEYIPESPVVIQRRERFYLLRTHGPRSGTYVFVSDRPDDFGRTAAESRERFVTRLEGVIAPEIITDASGSMWISTIADGQGSYAIRMAPLQWKR
jgi:hypothetical protein